MLRLVLWTVCSLCCDQPPDSFCDFRLGPASLRRCVQLLWLLVRQRITFKLCTMAFKCVHGFAPTNLSQMWSSVATVSARAGLRSAASGHLFLPGTRMSAVGRRGFYYACPAAWNTLPPALTAKSSLSLMAFKKQLKTFLYILLAWPSSSAHLWQFYCLICANVCLLLLYEGFLKQSTYHMLP